MSPDALNDALDAWQRGDLARDIAARVGVAPEYLRAYVSRARKAGDPRAIKRKCGQRPDPVARAGYAVAHGDGLSASEAAARLGISAGGVRSMWRKMGLAP